jgi:uncharacterized coiled-coil DUF342 family protein
MTNTPIDPAFGEQLEAPLPPLPSLADMKAALQANVDGLEAQIASAVEERSKINAQLAEDRAELTRRAEERRNELNEQIKEARDALKEASRLLNATKPRKPKGRAET